MSAAQELFELLKGAKPGQRYEKPKAKLPPEQVKQLREQMERRGNLFEGMPNWVAVDLPELGGDACIVSVFRESRHALGDLSTRENNLIARIDCERCNQPRLQQLVGRTFAGGETWAVLACTSCPLDLGVRT